MCGWSAVSGERLGFSLPPLIRKKLGAEGSVWLRCVCCFGRAARFGLLGEISKTQRDKKKVGERGGCVELVV